MPEPAASSYDSIAGMYHALWAGWYLPAALPALDQLFFNRISPAYRILDVCCGSGHVTKEIVRRGFAVTGVDLSAELIGLARRELPNTDLRVQDVRCLRLESEYDAALSTFDSLNHVLELSDLQAAFQSIHSALRPGALFVFDMNLEEAYTADVREWSVNLRDDAVGLVRGTFDFTTKLAQTELIWFVKQPGTECWKQHRSVVEQRCYARDEILAAVARAGFKSIEPISARAAGMDETLAFGRMFVSATG